MSTEPGNKVEKMANDKQLERTAQVGSVLTGTRRGAPTRVVVACFVWLSVRCCPGRNEGLFDDGGTGAMERREKSAGRSWGAGAQIGNET